MATRLQPVMAHGTAFDMMPRRMTGSFEPPRLSTIRPVSASSDYLDTEFEDESDTGDDISGKSSLDLVSGRSCAEKEERN